MASIYERMIAAAMALDCRPSPPEETPPHRTNGHVNGEQRPGDDFNARATWGDVLTGWSLVYERGGLTYWKRPGKGEPGISATTGIRTDCGKDLLYVFTTSTVLDSERSYSKFSAYARLNHGGNHSAAAKALHAAGWGEQSGPEVQFEHGGNGKTASPNGYSRPEETKPPPEQNTDPVLYTLPQLLGLEIPDPVWTVPGLLAEGLTILAGKPKLGKSMMALNLAITVAGGGQALGAIRTTAGDVLYLSLEDRLRRVKFRAEKMLGQLGVLASARLEIAIAWPRQGDGGLDHIERWLKRVANPRLVIVDVWQKFRPALMAGSQYEQDYNHASALKSLGDRYACSVMALHHCKKAKADDVVDEISGTLGLAGAADGLIVLSRARNENEAELFVSGRDTEEKQIAVEFDAQTFVWKHLGEAAERTESQIKAKVIELLKANVGAILPISEIADRLRLSEGKRDYLRTALCRMVDEGLVSRVSAGRYRWPVRDAE